LSVPGERVAYATAKIPDGANTLRFLADDGPADAPFSDTLGAPMGAGPHGGYGALTDQCAACHRAHTSQSPPLIASASTGNAFCMTCHDGTGASVPPYVSTHSNTDFSSPAEANFELQCTQCHDPHGSTNLADIRPDIRVTTSPLVTTGPVVFTALTGADSFDEDSGDGDDTDDLCVTCHINASNPGFPMADHGGGDHTGGTLGTDERNKDCTSCHPHDMDDNFSTLDGFMPSGCTGCHTSPQDDGDGNPAGGRRAVVGEFSANTHHVSGALQDADCQVCHDTATHSNGIVELVDPDNAVTIYTESSTGAYRTANLTAPDIADLTAFCQNCHDGDGATRLGGAAMTPFSGGTNPATVGTHSNTNFGSAVEASFQVGCVQCHESHGSSNLSTVKATVLVAPGTTSGSVVFTALTGADSFDEDSGDGSDIDDICVTCHINASNPGNPMTDHDGGDHTGGTLGTDERGKDCGGCHPHDQDDDPLTLDGFMPSGGSCVGCHKQTTGAIPRRQIVDSNGDGTGSGGDFMRSSHHVAGLIPTDADCEVCHEQTQHMAGTVRLFNADNAGTVYALDGTNDDVDYEDHCLSCHDGDGALKEATPLAPFSDALAPPTIDTAAWALASHDTAAGVGSCVSCHDNGHGSNKASLLAPWGYTSDGDPDDPLMEEERFCYNCHSSAGYPLSGTASTDIAAVFAPATNWSNAVVGTNALVNLNDRHDIAATDQATSASVIECVDCHDPHVATAASPLIADPDPTDGRTPGSVYFTGADFISDWCLDCHDGSYPSGVVDGHVDNKAAFQGLVNVLTLWDGDNNKDDSHGVRVGSTGSITEDGPPDTDGWTTTVVALCFDCHTYHVSGNTPMAPAGGDTNLFHLKNPVRNQYDTADLTTNAPAGLGTLNYELSKVDAFVSDQVNGYSWCNTCHDGAQMKSGDPNCTNCHMHGSRY
jgi:predicted CXXCH cytochrome family protein